MEGFLLRVLFFLVVLPGRCGEHLGQICYPSAKRTLRAFHCPGPLDGADAQFCCGTCSAPFCCESQERGFDPTQCSGFRQAVTPSSELPPEATSQPPQEGYGRLNYLWLWVGIIIAICILWTAGRNYDAFNCCGKRCRCCGSEEDSGSQEEIEMEELPPPSGFQTPSPDQSLPPPTPPYSLPPPPTYEDDPPPYSLLYPDPLALPPAVIKALRRIIPAQPSGAEGGAPAQPSGAEGGAPAQPSGAEGGAPAQPSGAEGGAPAM